MAEDTYNNPVSAKTTSDMICKQEPQGSHENDNTRHSDILDSAKRKTSDLTDTPSPNHSTMSSKKQKTIEKLDPDFDKELSTPDVLEVLKSGNKIFYSCNKCRKSCNNLKEFNDHSKKHEDEKVSYTKFYGCSLCKYMCKRPASLLKHIDHHGNRKYGCEACDYTTNRPSVLKLHLLTHSAERPFACSECSFRATREGYLRYHYLKKHEITYE